MKVKTSITLAEDLLAVIDQHASRYKNRSDFIEKAVAAFITQIVRQERDAKDREILDRQADDLNREAGDVLSYQVPL